MKDKIICLVGSSGSGKTTIEKELEKMGYNIIHSYTTREQREPNEWGHIFVTERDLKIHEREGQAIAVKEVYPGLYYWATKEQYQNKGVTIYAVCPDGAKQIRESVKDADVLTIFLQCDRHTRHGRMIKRMDNQDAIKDRLDKDDEIFKVCKCDYVVDVNRGLDEVLINIREIIG